jgi:hypothetical protein
MGPSSHPISYVDYEVHATDAHILPDVSIEASLLVFRSGLVPVTRSPIDATPRSRSFNRGSSRACSMRAILVDPEGESLDRLMSCSRWLTLTSNKLLSENHICLVGTRYVSGLRTFAMMGHGLVSAIGRYYCCAAHGDVRA